MNDIPKPPTRNKGGRPMLPQMIEAARWVIEGGWSMSDAAKRHGVSYSGLRKIANGIRRGERKAPWEEGKWKK